MDRPTKFNPVPAERKQLILVDAKKRIIEGETLEQIAHSHEISKKTLNNWLLALGEEYTELRQAWIDNMLSEAKEAIDNADEQLPLARAREQWKAATWYAERRDQRYAAKTEHKQDMSLSITVNRGQLERVIEVSTDELRKVEDKSLK